MAATKRATVRRKSERKSNQLHIRLTDDQKEALQKAAGRTGLTLSSWLIFIGLEKARESR